MGEQSRKSSRKRNYLARKFIELGKFESGLPAGFTAKNVLVGLGLVLLTTAILVEYEFQRIPDYEVGDISDRTVEAPEDFTVVDEEATQEKREEALSQVPAVFTFDFRVNHHVASEIRMAFADAREILKEERASLNLDENSSLPPAAQARVRGQIEDMLPRFSHGRILDICLKHGFSQQLEDQLVQLLAHSMKAPGVVLNRSELLRFRDRGLRLHNLVTGETRELDDWLALRELGQARDLLRQQEYELTRVTAEEKKELIDFLERWVVPNTYFDDEATREAERQALAEVDPVLIQVKQGRTILRAGDEVTEQNLSQLEALKDLKLHDRWIDRTAGVFLIVLLMYFIFWSYLQLHLVREKHQSDFLLFVLVMVGSLALTRLFLFFGESIAYNLRLDALQNPVHFYYMAPLALGSVVMMLLVGVNLSLFFALVYAVFVGLLTGELSIATYSLVGGLIAIYTLRNYRERSALIRAGVWISATNIVVAFAFQLLSASVGLDATTLLVRSVAGLVSGLSSAMLASLVLPSLESLFGLTTDIRLLELSNLNHPILRRLAMEAPGTYHHSLTVGTLAEAGAEAIGANSLLARVGAYYHDIGKLKHPEYYVENQIYATNKHETLSPTMSSLILASHVKDGLAIADEVKLGPRVAALIPQHHGTRVMTFFYQKAKEAAADKDVEVSENDFRYPGPRPETKEAAILMLADQVEAASRTLQDPSPGQIRSLIHRLLQGTIQDGQFDECDITMKELHQVAQGFERVITGMYHHRIEYPGFNFNKQRVEETRVESQSVQ